MIFYGKASYRIRKNTVRSRLFSVYRRVFGEPDPHSHIRWRSVWPMIEKAGRTLDVGCGTGSFTFDVAKKTGGEVVGLVYTGEEMERAVRLKESYGKSRKGRRVDFVMGDILHLENLGLYDQVLCIDVIEHVEDDAAGIAQMAKVLRPGGNLIISTITREYPKCFGWGFHQRVGHVREGYEEKELRELLEREGLDIVDLRCHGNAITRAIALVYYRKGYFERHPLLWYAVHPAVALAGLLDPFLPSSRPLGISLKARKRHPPSLSS